MHQYVTACRGQLVAEPQALLWPVPAPSMQWRQLPTAAAMRQPVLGRRSAKCVNARGELCALLAFRTTEWPWPILLRKRSAN